MNIEGESSASSAPTSEDMKIASAAALSAAVLKSQVLALREEREIEKLVIKVIELQTQKIQLKMANFRNLEKLLDEEQKKVFLFFLNFLMQQLEGARQQLAVDKLRFEEQKIQVGRNATTPSTSVPATGN